MVTKGPWSPGQRLAGDRGATEGTTPVSKFELITYWVAVVFLLPLFVWGLATRNKGIPGSWANRVFLAQPGLAEMLYLWGLIAAVNGAYRLGVNYGLIGPLGDRPMLIIGIAAGLVLVASIVMLVMGVVKERRQRGANGAA